MAIREDARMTSRRAVVYVFLSMLVLVLSSLPSDAQDEAAPSIQFSFKNATIDEVVDFFARESGLPVIREVDAPQGNVTFLSADAYDLEESLRVLNTILQTRGVMLRRDAEFLYLQKLDNMKAEAVPTFPDGMIPADVTDEQVISVVYTLENASAAQIAEQFGALVAGYGSIVALPMQNAVIVTETAAQCRRIGAMLASLDMRPAFEESIEVFPLAHIRAADAVASLNVLVAEKKVTVVIDKQGNRNTVEEEDLAGIRLEADERTNSVIALGPSGRLSTVESLVRLLDVPARGGQELTAFPIETMRPEEAARIVRAMYVATPQERQPTLVPLEPAGKLAVIGPEAEIDRVGRLLAELEGGSLGGAPARAVVIELEHITPERCVEAVRSLASERQKRTVRMAPLPSRSAVVLSGDADAVQAVRELVAACDVPERATTRLVDLRAARAATIIEDVRLLVAQSPELAEGGAVVVKPIDRTNSVLVTAPPSKQAAIESMIRRLDVIEPADLPPLRLLQVRTADAQAVARVLTDQYRRRPQEQRSEKPVDIRADTATNTLIVSAHPELYDEIKSFVDELNTPTTEAERITEIFPLAVAKAQDVALALERLYPEPPAPRDRRGRPMPWAREPREINVSADVASNSLIVDAPAERMPAFKALVDKLDRVEVPPRAELRTYRVEQAELEAVARTMRSLAQRGALSGPAQPGKPRVPITIETEPASRTLIVSGPEEAFVQIESVLEQLDAGLQSPESKLLYLGLAHARVDRVTPLVQRVLDARWSDIAQREGLDGEQTRLDVAADEATNTLILTVPPQLVDTARELVARLDGPEAAVDRDVVRILPLEFADAPATAASLQQTLRGAALPSGREVRITAAGGSNALVVSGTEADIARVVDLVDALDRPARVQSVDVRTVRLQHARAEQIAPIVERLLAGQQISDWLRWNMIVRRMEVDDETPVRVAAEARINAVIVTAPPQMLAVAEEIIRELDIEAGAAMAGSGRPVRVIPLTNARASSMAETIRAIFTDDPASTGPEPVIRVDDTANSLIVRATPAQLVEIDAVVRRVDAAALTSTRQMRMIPIDRSRSDASEMASTIRRLLERQGGVAVEVLRADELLQEGSGTPQQRVPESEPEGPAESRGKLLLPRRLKLILGYTQTVLAAAEQAPKPLEPLDGATDVVGPAEPPSSEVTIAVDAATNTLIVMGSTVATERIAALAQQLQEQLPPEPGRVRIVELSRGTNANAIASIVNRTLRQMGRVSASNPSGMTGAVSVIPDQGSQTLVVAANDTDFAFIGGLVGALDKRVEETGDERELAVIPLATAMPSNVARILDRVLIAGDRARRARISVYGENSLGLLLVRAPEEEMAEIRGVVAEVDRADVGELPITPIKLERADATAVAAALQQFFDDRARASTLPGRQRQERRVAIVGDRRTSTVLVAAGEEDLEQVRDLVSTFDAPAEARDLRFRVIPLANARVGDVLDTLQRLAGELQWMSSPWWNSRGGGSSDKILLEGDTRSNSIVVLGQGESFDTIAGIVAALDTAREESAQITARVITLESADPNIVRRAAEQAFADPNQARRWWEPADPSQPRFEVDTRSGNLIAIGPESILDEVEAFVARLDEASPDANVLVETVSLTYADAQRVERSMRRFFQDRARLNGLNRPAVSVIGSSDGNALIITAPESEMPLAFDVAAKLDRPDMSDSQSIEIYALEHAESRELAGAIRDLFPRRARSDSRVTAVPDVRTNSVVVTAPQERLAEIEALIERMDAPPSGDVVRIQTFALESARAPEVAETLRAALDLSNDARGRAGDLQGRVRKFVDASGGEIEVIATVTPDLRSNSLLVTADDASMGLIAELISGLDAQPAVRELSYRVFTLENVVAGDVQSTLRSLLARRRVARDEPQPVITSSRRDNTLIVSATAEQLTEIERILAEIDVPSRNERVTEFVTLEFAESEQVRDALSVFYGRFASAAETPGALNVSVVADPATNSLVVSAEPEEWPGIRELISKLDAEEYDASRHLEVIPLEHADATSLAEALQTAFDAPLRRRVDEQRRRQSDGNDRNEREAPSVLVQDAEVVTISAEPLTNTLVVAATRKDVDRIRATVRQLDVPEFASLAPPRLIALSGPVRASDVAQALLRMYELSDGGSGRTLRSVRIVGDDASNTLIVRADDGEFEQIRTLAQSLQDEGGRTGVRVRVLPVASQSAPRLAETIRQAFGPTAAERNEQLTVAADRRGNALLVGSSEALFEQIAAVVAELDGGEAQNVPEAEGAVSAPGRALLIVDIENTSPQRITELVTRLGLTRDPGPDAPGVVSEPVTIVPMTTRRAVSVLVAPGDRSVVEAVIGALDVAGDADEQRVAIVPLREAQAANVVRTIESILSPQRNDARTALASSLTEQVRRLTLAGQRLEDAEIEVDLDVPIRLEPEPTSNTVIIASTAANVGAIEELIGMLDRLPAGDAIVMRIVHLENASASRVRSVLRDLFDAGDAIRRTPGTDLRAMPTTETGRALAASVAMTIDERTNALIVAGPEEAVALTEVLIDELDGDSIAGWVEPRLIPLRHADSTKLAATIRSVLVEGIDRTPEGEALRRQVGRLRMLREQDGAPELLDSEVFVPLSRLIVLPEEQLNALVVVGSRPNVDVVTELVEMLDVEGASRFDTVRVYPLENAEADRVAGLLENLFAEQVRSGALRETDAVTIQPDARSNSLVVATSPRSFAVIEGLLQTLDAADVQSTVGLHVISVGANDASALAPKIEQVMRDRLRAMDRDGSASRDVVSVRADEATNSLIVAASEENLRLIKNLVEVLGQEAPVGGGPDGVAGGGIEIFSLKSARAQDMAQLLNELYVREVNRTRGEGTLTVRADERLNAIVVNGGPRDVAEIRSLIERLDGASLDAVREIRIIRLDSANSLELVNLLKSVLAGRGLDSRVSSSRQSTLIRFAREKAAAAIEGETGRQPTDTEVSAAIREQVTLTPDLRTNSIIVSAPPPMLILLEAMIAELDSSASGAREIRVFSLENADAENMANLLRDLFNLRQQGNLYVLVPTAGPPTPEQEALGESLGLGDVTLTVVPDERQALAITIDARTNSLLVSGSPRFLEIVEEVVLDLDAQTGAVREQFTYELKNARVDEVADALQEFIDQELDRLERALGPERSGSVMRRLEREISVVGVPGSSRLIVSVSPRYRETIQSLIDELDKAPPQVLIQVLLAEVTLDSENTFGVDFTLNPVGGLAYEGFFRAAGSGVLTAIGVPNLSVSSLDFDLLIRALEEQGRLEVLSRPQILVNDNEDARIQVGEEVRLVTNVERLENGNTRSDVTPREVGVILDVTPSVSPDGFVRLDITPEISAVSERTTQVSEDFEAPIVTQRRAQTTVTVKDGQTIVIGGLIQNRSDTRETKVPIIGDIPIIGIPFRSEKRTVQKTELLIILTPRVILTERELYERTMQDLTDREINRLSLPDDVKDALRRNEIEGDTTLGSERIGEEKE
jgi:type II secretion system protein D